MKKLLFVAPHLSTGGLPQYLVKKVELLRDRYDIYVVEYNDYSGGRLVVQKNRLKELLKNELITLRDNKHKLLDIIRTIRPDIVHMEEIPELFCDPEVAKSIYTEDRTYSIYETSHDSSTDIKIKRFFPDRFVLVSEFQRKMFEPLGIPIEVIDYPIEFSDNHNRQQYRKDLGLDETKKHILNVGLFTPRKNQKEFFEYARKLPEYQFHSVGNMADNFKYYWEPLLKGVPENVKIWDERSDVYKFYEAMDLLLFTSRGSDKDKETMPLVLKEAVSANMPIALYNLPVYEGFFDQFNGIHYLDFDDKERNVEIIKSALKDGKPVADKPKPANIKKEKENIEYKFFSRWSWNEQKMTYSSQTTISHPIIVTIREYKTDAVLWSSEYDRFPTNSEYWMLPVPKSYMDYKTSDAISGVKICIYKKDGQQIYENVFFKEFKPLPNIGSLSNTEPYFINFAEYFIRGKYDRFFEGMQYDNVVDVGANVGIFTSYILHKKLSKNVIAVECHPKALEDLNKNFDINPNVKVVEKALSSDCNPINLISFVGKTTTSTPLKDEELNKRNEQKADTITCDSITLKELIDQLGYIDLLKVDIEGGEYEIFEKLEPELFQKINHIFLECHIFNQSHKDRCKGFLAKLEASGFEVDTSLLDERELFSKEVESECIYAKRK